MSNIPEKHITLTDLLVITMGLGMVGMLSISQWQQPHHASFAIVHNNHGEQLRISMQENHHYAIAGRLGKSQLEVSDGKIRFIQSPCSQHLCIHTGWLKESGEAAACLPNGISLVLHSDARRYDSINF
jgi:hypothetical protein